MHSTRTLNWFGSARPYLKTGPRGYCVQCTTREITSRNFKVAYYTITRNKVYVIIAELNLPTKLIRLTKATLTTVKRCGTIQNNCLNPFQIRQGLGHEHVLSTLLFNVVLNAIVTTSKTTNDWHHVQEADTISRLLSVDCR
jgi:hypothetical protein